MTKNISQGTKANKNGKNFEAICIPLFENGGFTVYKTKKEFEKAKKQGLPSRYVQRNATYTSIYKHTGRTEYVLVDGDRRIRIENKYQSQAGSVDEKFPYVYLNAVMAYPEQEIVIVLGGNGFKPQAIQWLKDQVKNNWLNTQGKIIHVFRIDDFLSWMTSEF